LHYWYQFAILVDINLMLAKKNILPSRKINTDLFGLVNASPSASEETETSHFFAPGLFSENSCAANLLYSGVLDERISYSKPMLNTANSLFHDGTNAGVVHECRASFRLAMLTPEAKRNISET